MDASSAPVHTEARREKSIDFMLRFCGVEVLDRRQSLIAADGLSSFLYREKTAEKLRPSLGPS